MSAVGHGIFFDPGLAIRQYGLSLNNEVPVVSSQRGQSPSTHQPTLPIVDPYAAMQIEQRRELDWFHSIDVGGFTTPGLPYNENWEFVADFLQRHTTIFEGADVLEPGCADGLWTCWLTKLHARHIDSTDVADRDQFRLIVQAFGLPASYYPGILSTRLPLTLRRRYDVVCSLGLLYHVHDPFATLTMYRRYLREGGWLVLETGGINENAPYLHYTGAGGDLRQGGRKPIPADDWVPSICSS
jgi:SAM-dependent methyltransferase